MKTSPLLLGAALLFWGWQTGLLFFAILLAASLEGSRLIRVRWTFSQADFNRIWNLCTLLFVGAFIIAFAANEGRSAVTGMFDFTSGARRSDAFNKTSRAMLLVFQWLPLTMFPVMAAQAFSSGEAIDLSTFSWLLRQLRTRAAKAALPPSPGVNVSFPYFAVCLLAASATKNQAGGFYWELVLLLSWALWTRRSKRFSFAHWGGLLGMTVGLGYAGHQGLFQLQKTLETLDTAWLSRFARQHPDAKESRTSIGSIGKLKFSGRIALRLETAGEPPPGLLREASYNLFRSPLWYVTKKDFESLTAEPDDTTWELLPGKVSKRSVTISRYLNDGKGLLALPHGASRLEQLAATLETNRLGVVRVVEAPGLVSYLTRYDEGASIDSPPDVDDLAVPGSEEPALSQIANELNLAGQASEDPRLALQTVADFFEKNFEYSSYLTAAPRASSDQTALAAFLLKNHAGHCEYFATATALLLRKAGIPARYAAGYSVQEGSGKKFVVRQRHAHAWCLAWFNGAWHDFDTTPPSWHAIETRNASFWEPLADAWSRLWFEFSQWRWGRSGFRKYMAWVLFPLVLVLVLRLFLKKQWTRLKRQLEENSARRNFPGMDSEFYLIEQKLGADGLERRAGETLSAWLKRIEASAPVTTRPLREMMWLHYRHRFDPLGLGAQERTALKTGVYAWLNQNGSASFDKSSNRTA